MRFIVLLLLPTMIFAQSSLTTITTDGFTIIPPNYTCYDKDSVAVIDDALKLGVGCKAELHKCNKHVSKLRYELSTDCDRPMAVENGRGMDVGAIVIVALGALVSGMVIGTQF